MESALSTALQRPGHIDIIVPVLLHLIHLTVLLCLSVMIFVEVYKAIMILVKLFREHPERRIQIPMYNEKEAMNRVNAVLQRELEEVESRIGRLLEHPPSTYIHDDNNDKKVSLYQITRKINFLKNLLTAEMNSRSPHMLENLNRMATRLSILQKAFVDWANRTRMFSKLDESFANWVESVDNNGPVCPDTSTSGSCTKSCVVEAKVNRDDEERNRKQHCRGVRICMAMGCAAITGFKIGFTSALISMALANIRYMEETVYLVPT